jgi:hypothetical protein
VGNMHVGQSHITENALDATVGKRNLLAASADVTPSLAAVLEMGRLDPIPLNVDSYNSAVFHLQSEFPPGITGSASEIENSLRWHFARRRV